VTQSVVSGEMLCMAKKLVLDCIDSSRDDLRFQVTHTDRQVLALDV
jgi:hypothetical protein